MKLKPKQKNKKSAQEIQDDIFRRMSADRKVKLGSQLWQLAKDLVGNKIRYGTSKTMGKEIRSFGDFEWIN